MQLSPASLYALGASDGKLRWKLALLGAFVAGRGRRRRLFWKHRWKRLRDPIARAARNAALARTIIYNLPMLDVRRPDGPRHRRLAVVRKLAALVVIVASAWVNGSFAQRPPSPAVGPDGFLSLPQKISVQSLEGLKATAVDPSADTAFDLDVRNNMLIVKLSNAEIARGFLSESDGTRETCYGFDRDDGRLKEAYSLCQARVDLVLTARPTAKDGYFASLRAGALYFKFTLLDRNHGGNEAVYSAAMLRPRK